MHRDIGSRSTCSKGTYHMQSFTPVPHTNRYVTYLSESFWLAAVWDFDLMYATDYAEGTVYEMEVSSGTGEFENIIALAYVDYPR